MIQHEPAADREPISVNPNPGRAATIEVRGSVYARIPVRTHIVTAADDIVEVIERYAGPLVRPGDVVVVSEKVVAITQGRAVPVEQIRVGTLAKLLWPRVRQVRYGIGLRSPYSMQCAIDECGRLRILAAALVGAVGKLFGRRGDFYRVAGIQAAMIDAAGTAGIEQFKGSVIKGPKDPDVVARRIAERLGQGAGAEPGGGASWPRSGQRRGPGPGRGDARGGALGAAVVDVNDIGGSWAVGASPGLDRSLVEAAMKDNPLGQGGEQTPVGIIRKLES